MIENVPSKKLQNSKKIGESGRLFFSFFRAGQNWTSMAHRVDNISFYAASFHFGWKNENKTLLCTGVWGKFVTDKGINKN